MASDAHGRLAPGTQLLGGALVIEGVLGQGGAGITYRAQQLSPRRTVAVKEFYPQDFVTRYGPAVVPRAGIPEEEVASLRAMFRIEADTLASFNHPAIVQVYQVFEENQTVYMVLEFVDGQPLKAYLPLPDEGQVMGWLGPICDALEMVHDRGFLHRDIAPDNILVRRDGRPVLLDFGAARMTQPERTRIFTRHLISKQGYSAPEQYVDGAEHAPSTDIYALAATAWCAVAGHPPPGADRRAHDVNNGAPDPMPALAERASTGFSAAFVAALETALSLRMAERPASVPAFRAALAGTRTVRTAGERAAATRPKRRRAPMVALVLLIAGLGAELGGAFGPSRILAALAPDPAPDPDLDADPDLDPNRLVALSPTPVETPPIEATPVPDPTPQPTPVVAGKRTDPDAVIVAPVVHGGAGEDALHAIAALPDGGYVAAGLRARRTGTTDAWLIRLDETGRAVWSRDFGGAGADAFFDVTARADGVIVAAGETEGTDGVTRAWVLAVDGDGAVLHEASFLLEPRALGSTFRGVAPDAAGGVVLAGSLTSLLRGATLSIGAPYSRGAVVRLGPDWAPLWERSFDPDGASGTLVTIAPGLNGTFLAAGTVRTEDDGGGLRDTGWLLSLDGNGQSAWPIPPVGSGLLRGLLTPEAGGALAVGSTGDGTAWAVRFNQFGQRVWSQTYGDGARAELHDAVALPDGGFLLVGSAAGGWTGGSDGILIRIAADGTERWSSPTASFGDDGILAASRGPDGAVMLAGFALNEGQGGAWVGAPSATALGEETP